MPFFPTPRDISDNVRRFFGGGDTSRVGRYTFFYHSRAVALEGVFNGVFLLNDVVARKALHASDFWVMVIVMIPGASLLLSVYFSTLIPREHKRKVFLWSGIFGRLILVGAAWIFVAPSFAALIALSSLTFPVLLPAYNAVFQANYGERERGRLFGMGAAITSVTTVAVSVAAGMLLDAHEHSYRVIYPAAGVVGFLACWLFYRIRWRSGFGDGADWHSRTGPPFTLNVLWVPFRRAVDILREHRDFAAYEGAYFVYGCGFMITATLLPLYLVDEIGVSYEQAAHMKGLIYYSLLVALSSAFGRLCDARNPMYVSRLAFTMLAFVPLAFHFAHHVESLYAAFFLFGIAMAAVNVGWNLGPIYFSQGRDSTAMMGVHVALTGVRALIAHPAAIVLKNFLGSTRSAFLVASALFVTASFMMGRLERRVGGK